MLYRSRMQPGMGENGWGGASQLGFFILVFDGSCSAVGSQIWYFFFQWPNRVFKRQRWFSGWLVRSALHDPKVETCHLSFCHEVIPMGAMISSPHWVLKYREGTWTFQITTETVLHMLLQPVPWKMRLEMVVGMQNEILNGTKKLPFYVSFQIYKWKEK